MRLSPVEIHTIKTISKYKHVTIGQLSQLLGIKAPTTHVRIITLELKGMVIPHRVNGFIKDICLTKDGGKITNSCSSKEKVTNGVGSK